MKTVYIIDYGICNIGSLENMIKKVGYKPIIVTNPSMIKNPKKIILPGIGNFNKGVENLKKKGFWEYLKNFDNTNDSCHLLGICLGMHLLMNKSEESPGVEGLSLIDAEVVRFSDETDLTIPQMNWNHISLKDKSNNLFEDFDIDNHRFYFVHSFFVNPKNKNHIIATTKYGVQFCSIVNDKNIFGMQFHPEKSLSSGKKIIENFCKL
jgi:imidazole glycerol-phosphate synthase subunit HisH